MKTIEYPANITEKTDGETHINIYSRGKTWLGRELSNFAHRPFNHPEHGLFASIEGYWYWLSRRDDDLRHLHGFKAKQHARELPVITTLPNALFQKYICMALDAKLKKHPELREALKESSLPLTHYYVTKWNKERAVMAPNSLWLLCHIESQRLELNPGADRFNMDLSENPQKPLMAKRKDDDQIDLFV